MTSKVGSYSGVWTDKGFSQPRFKTPVISASLRAKHPHHQLISEHCTVLLGFLLTEEASST